MANLSALKRTADMTTIELKAWYAVLAGFPSTVLNRAIIEVALTKERFPDVGDLYQICRRSLPKRYCAHGDGEESSRLAPSEIAAVAERLGLQI